jgi:hypothetical protein
MKDLFKLILGILASLFKSRAKLEAEILILRQQINVLRRQAPKRPHLNNTDRFLFDWLYRWFPSVLGAIAIIRPETIIRWHRAGFRAYWRWRSRNHVGRPKVSAELRTLIGEMSRANPLWGAPHTAWTTNLAVVWRDGKPDCGVDLAPDHRGFPMGPRAAIPHSGSGHFVWASLRAASARHGYSRSADCVPITLAKRLR